MSAGRRTSSAVMSVGGAIDVDGPNLPVRADPDDGPADALDCRLDEDREYFLRHPVRRYRLRAAFPNELLGATAHGGRDIFVVVERNSPAVRTRIFCLGRPNLRAQWSDDEIAMMVLGDNCGAPS